MSQAGINYQSHLFYIDPNENKYSPPWFLELATRQEAEKILSRSAGNVLMRTHSSFESTKKYVITYRRETDRFRHYLLLNTPDGFLLEIDHTKNRPVNCLSEAMDLFIKLAGRPVQPIDYGSSPEYMNQNSGRSTIENTKKTNINKNVPRNLESSTEPLWTSHNYINTPQVSAMGELNRTIPFSPEKLSHVEPHSYVNAPQLSAASNSSTFFTEETVRQHNAKEPRSYVNLQQLSPTDDTYAERPGFRSRPMTADEFPPDIAPPLPEQN